ncbi:MAG: hypothetical protein K9G49_16100 [Taibaiella sp.]|nr:hypothetical protein [Taibaiella sp.]
MKRILTSMLLLLSLVSQARKEKHKPAFDKGKFTALVGTGYPNFMGYYGNGKPQFTFIAATEYQASRRFAIGLQYLYSYSVFKRNGYLNYNSNLPAIQFTQKTYTHVFMATAEYVFLNRGRVSLSSGIGLGYVPTPKVKTIFDDNIDHSDSIDTELDYWHLAFRLRLVTMKLKLKENLGVYFGVGYGSDGLLSGGVHYTFTGKKD